MSATSLRGASNPASLLPPEAVGVPASGAEPPRPLSLTTKLADVMAAVGRIAKRGRNEFHGYDYATEADIVEAVRAELAKRHILIYPEVVDYEVRELSAAHEKKAARLLTLLRLRFLIEDGDTGERVERLWLGAGEDSGDKGVYKAMTGGDKYFLLKLLLIPTGDDPERDTRKSPGPSKRALVNATTGEILDDALVVTGKSPTPTDNGQLRIVTVTSQPTRNKNVTKFLLALSDGRTASTIRRQWGEMAEQLCQNAEPVDIEVRETRWGLEVTALHRAGTDAPGFTSGMDDADIPF